MSTETLDRIRVLQAGYIELLIFSLTKFRFLWLSLAKILIFPPKKSHKTTTIFTKIWISSKTPWVETRVGICSTWVGPPPAQNKLKIIHLLEIEFGGCQVGKKKIQKRKITVKNCCVHFVKKNVGNG